jgi:hypothetical protein
MKIIPMVSLISVIQKAIRYYYYKERALHDFNDDREGVSMIVSKNDESKIQLIRDGKEESISISMLDTDTHQIKTNQLADKLTKNKILNEAEFREVQIDADPFTKLCMLLVRKKMLTMDEINELLEEDKAK